MLGREGGQCLPQLLDRLEVLHPEQLLLEGADRTLGHAVALGLPNEGGRAEDAEALDLVLEVVRHVVRAVVMAQGQAPGHVRSHTAEVPRDALPDRLQRLLPACARGGMSADELARAMIHGDEHISAPLIGSVLAAMQIHRNGHLLRLLCRDDANPRSAEQSVASLHSATIVKRENPLGVGENGVKRPTFGKLWTEKERPEHDAGAAYNSCALDL